MRAKWKLCFFTSLHFEDCFAMHRSHSLQLAAGSFKGLPLAGLALWACATAGCAATLGPSIAHDERELYRAPQFDYARLEAGGVSILMVTSRVAPEGIREDVAFVIDQAAERRLVKVKVVSRSETLARVREAGMTGDLQRLIRGYEERGAIDAAVLRRMAALQEVRYFLATTIIQYERTTRDIESPPSTFVTPGLQPARRGTERVQRIRLRGDVWDSYCGAVVWTGEGETAAVEETASEEVRLDDVLVMAATNLISVFPRPGEAGRTSDKECGA